ncbi:hypothetical protein [Engelhardtia mirabilis]|uniref:hypothetical protein n=1 Tax=Engelhardtia mirabilis TaxID=2528011 RepID=UPI0011A40364
MIEAPDWAALAAELARPLLPFRGVSPDAISIAFSPETEDPEAFLRDVHERRYDEDVAEVRSQAVFAIEALGRQIAVNENQDEARQRDLKRFWRYEPVPRDGRIPWSAFERLWVLAAILGALILMAMSVVQLGQLLVEGGFVDDLHVGLRFGFLPLVAAILLEVLGDKVLQSEQAKTRLLTALCVIGVSLIGMWAYAFLTEYGATMTAEAQIDIESLASIDLGDLLDQQRGDSPPEEEEAPGSRSGPPLVLLFAVLGEICGAAALGLCISREFHQHGSWTLGKPKIVRTLERESKAAAEERIATGKLLAGFQGRMDRIEIGRRNVAEDAVVVYRTRRAKLEIARDADRLQDRELQISPRSAVSEDETHAIQDLDTDEDDNPFLRGTRTHA